MWESRSCLTDMVQRIVIISTILPLAKVRKRLIMSMEANHMIRFLKV